MEMTWSVWLNIDRVSGETSYQHIFNKGGNGNFSANGIMMVNNAPGVYLSGNDNNTIHILMNTVSENNPSAASESMDISNFPLGKWVHLCIRMENKIMDVYVNGVITKRLAFQNVPKQNFDNVFVCANGGFMGNLSDLKYYDKALNVFEIMNLTIQGPNLTAASGSYTTSPSTMDYLSNRWYQNGGT
jgi:hypothetical protein